MGITEKIREMAENYRDYTAENLSKLVKTKSYSSKEEDVCRLIVELCKEAGFDDVYIDGLGSVVGRVGNGPKKIAFDAHIDTVEVGNMKNWKFDPFSGEIKDGLVLGRGASDQKGGAASMITAGRMHMHCPCLNSGTSSSVPKWRRRSREEGRGCIARDSLFHGSRLKQGMILRRGFSSSSAQGTSQPDMKTAFPSLVFPPLSRETHFPSV